MWASGGSLDVRENVKMSDITVFKNKFLPAVLFLGDYSVQAMVFIWQVNSAWPFICLAVVI